MCRGMTAMEAEPPLDGEVGLARTLLRPLVPSDDGDDQMITGSSMSNGASLMIPIICITFIINACHGCDY